MSAPKQIPTETPAEALAGQAILPGEAFYERLAEEVLAFGAGGQNGELSALCILVPSMPVAAELRSALRRAAPRAMLLPRFATFAGWARETASAELAGPLPESARLVLLYEALRAKPWFDEASLWGIAGEMAGLFDELSEAERRLPDDAEALAAPLRRAYSLPALSAAPLSFEAHVVHALWQALAASGGLDAPAAHRQRLAEIARRAAAGGDRGDTHAALPPLFVVLGASPDEALTPAERVFFEQYGRFRKLGIFHPAPRESPLAVAASSRLAVLDGAWREDAAVPLFGRAQVLRARFAESPLAGGLRFVAAAGREQEAQAAVAQIGAWLAAGRRRIALLAQDRLTARRVRALLERENILLCDETGWRLSTSRAAAAIDALLETVASDAYHRDLLDLCKSPFLFADLTAEARQDAVFTLDRVVRSASVKSGLARLRRCLDESASGAEKALCLMLIDRVETATRLLRQRPAPLALWLERLTKAFDALGAMAALRQDAAGEVILDTLAVRYRELAANTTRFSFVAWREWLDREFENAAFGNRHIVSPLVLTPLKAVRLRHFEAAVLLGGDARQLGTGGGAFFNQAVRRELGLRTHEDEARERRRELEWLFSAVPRVTVTWQAERDGEANPLAPDLARLSTLHALAWGDDLRRPPAPPRRHALSNAASVPAPAARLAAPSLPGALWPQRLSVSAYAGLIDCPYRFFARHVLGLGEMDEVREAMEKSEYGQLVHRVLERFHARHPLISALSEAAAWQALDECSRAVFAPAVANDFLVTGWQLRWEKQAPAYLEWQRQREAEGWRFAAAEVQAARALPLADGSALELHGRIDRIDQKIGKCGETEEGGKGLALLDYKTQPMATLRARRRDDVQLPTYALLHGGVEEAAYVALDGGRVGAVAAGEAEFLAAAAEAQGQRLRAVFDALRAGAGLPAHGAEQVCAWCEMDGLCRREHVA